MKRAAVAFLAVHLAGCGAAEPVAEVTFETLPNGAVLVRNPQPDRMRGLPEIRAEEVARIGTLEGDEAYMFGSVLAVEVGRDGRVYVLDNQARNVRIFDAHGRHLRTVGRDGGGPGEFRNPRGMTWDPEGNLWVADVGNQRFTVLSPDGDVLGSLPRTVLGHAWRWEGAFGADDALYEPSVAALPDGIRRVLLRQIVQGETLTVTDTFPLPGGERSFYQVETSRSAVSVAVPFAPVTTWTLSREPGFWIGSGESYRLVRTTARGDTVQVIEMAVPQRQVSSAERERAHRHLAAVLEPHGLGLDRLDLSRIPGTRPSFSRFFPDPTGRLWVAEHAFLSVDEGQPPPPVRFDIFAPEGRYEGSVTLGLDAESPPSVRGGFVAGVNRDALGVERVVVYRLTGLP